MTEKGSNFGKKLVLAALARPHLIIVICLVTCLLGLMAIITIPKDLLPAGNIPAVQIISYYPGMPVRDVEETLTARLERNTAQAIGMNHQESKSLVGVSIVKNYFSPGSDLNTAMTQTTSLILGALSQLPPGTQPPYILPFDPMAAIPMALVAVRAKDNKTIEEIYDTSRYEVRNNVQSVPGAMAPTVMGGRLREIVLYLDSNKLNEYNFSLLNVLEIFSRLNTFIPSGDVKIGDLDYQILSNGVVEKIQDMNNFPLRGQYGVPVFVNQLGQVKDSGTIQTNVVLIDGQEEVYVPVYREPGGNSLKMVKEIKQSVTKLQDRLDDYVFTVVGDQTIFIKNAIRNISEEALLGGGLAALMILFFLGNLRASFGIMLSLPLSLLTAFIGLQASGQTINVMTLGGLALSIGVLVDNSIVVLENISKKLEQGLNPYEAAKAGASEVAMPVLASTLVTLIVLFPVLYLTGIVQILFAALAKSVIFVMLASFFVSMTVMPLFAAYCLKNQSDQSLPKLLYRTKINADRCVKKYGQILPLALQHRKRVMGGSLGIFLLGMVLMPFVGTELFPKADSGSMIITARLPSATRIEKTTEFAKAFDQQLRHWISKDDLKMVIANAGVFYGFPAAFTPNVGTQDVFFYVELTPERNHTSQYYAKLIRDKFPEHYPEVEVAVELGGLLSSAINYGARAPINVVIEGPKVIESYHIAESVLSQIKKIKGAVDVRIQERFDAPMINLAVNRDAAMNLGITTDEVIKNVISAVTGSATFDYKDIWVDPSTGINYFMAVQFEENKIASFDDLANIPIQAAHRNRSVPLKQVATITEIKGPLQANHHNFHSVINLYLDAQGRDIGSVTEDVIGVLKSTQLPLHYSWSVQGEYQEMSEALDSLQGGILLAIILVYLILVVQFRSFSLPLIIMTTVPIGLAGIVFMFLLTDTYFSIQAAIGAIFMIGIAVANGVILIEFLRYHSSVSGSIEEGIIKGASARLRPIMMTSLAAILGVLPMAIGLGHGSEANIPLARAVIGGQLLSVTLTLFLVPVLFYHFFALKRGPK